MPVELLPDKPNNNSCPQEVKSTGSTSELLEKYTEIWCTFLKVH